MPNSLGSLSKLSGNLLTNNPIRLGRRQMWIPGKCDILWALSVLTAFSVACDQATPSSPSATVVEARPAEVNPVPIGESDPDIRLAQLRSERLGVVDQVALWKWTNAKPIEDPAREAKVLVSVEQLASDRGLDRAKARKFFESLMADARERQHTLHDSWRKTGPPPETPAIEIEELRRKIDSLTPQLIEAWGRTAWRP